MEMIKGREQCVFFANQGREHEPEGKERNQDSVYIIIVLSAKQALIYETLLISLP